MNRADWLSRTELCSWLKGDTTKHLVKVARFAVWRGMGAVQLSETLSRRIPAGHHRSRITRKNAARLITNLQKAV